MGVVLRTKSRVEYRTDGTNMELELVVGITAFRLVMF